MCERIKVVCECAHVEVVLVNRWKMPDHHRQVTQVNSSKFILTSITFIAFQFELILL